MPIGSNILAGASGQATGYDIENSLRFDAPSVSRLYKTFASAGNQKTWTFSCWLKPGNIGTSYSFFGVDGGAAGAQFAINSDSDLSFYSLDSSASIQTYLVTDRKFRDPSSWYHIVLSYDSTQAVASNRVKIYVNGSQVTDFSTSTYPDQNDDSPINNSDKHSVGGDYRFNDNWDGYLAEVIFLDGIAASPSDLGETNSATNQWVPIEYAGSYGTNGFYLPFSATELAASFTDSSSSSHTITANGDVTNTRAQKKIGSSSIKFDGTGDYLSLADSADWNIFGSGNWTTETWVKLDNHSQAEHLFGQYASGTSKWEITHNGAGTNNGLSFGLKIGSGAGSWVIDSGYASGGSGEITDTNWHHVALVKESDDYTMYLDGTALDNTVTDTDTDDISGPLSIGQNGANGSYLTGYMDEIRISNSARYTSSFTPSTTAFTADSNTKLLIHSDFNGGLGADSSGNTNDFTPTNLVATDQVLDSPTNNFATLNPLDGNSTWSEGNLKVVTPATGYSNNRSTFFCPAGTKWYWEFVPTTGYNYAACGITTNSHEWTINPGGGNSTPSGHGVGFYGTELDVDGTRNASTITAWASGDIIGFAYDVDSNEIKYYINGSLSYTYSSVPTSTDGPYSPSFGDFGGSVAATINVNFGQDSSFGGLKTAQGNTDANGIGDFYYTPPGSGSNAYLALCTDNLPDPSIADPTAHFNTVTYTGNGSTQSITGVGFEPDAVWIKARNNGFNHYLVDQVRGFNGSNARVIQPNLTNAEESSNGIGDSFSSFDSDGFSVALGTGSWAGTNYNTGTYASWNWKAGGTPTVDNSAGAGNTPTAGSVKIDGANLGSALAGSIAATRLSANTTAGFSIVSFDLSSQTGAETIGHGLSQAPEMIMLKSRGTAYNWSVYQKDIGNTKRLILNDNVATSTFSQAWNNTSPTSSVFSIGDAVWHGADEQIAYCFHSVDGYSKVGSYEGNGNADGSFIYLGFKPEFFLIKNIDAVEAWEMWDGTRETYNKLSKKISPNTSDAEYTANTTTYAIDFLSNGVKLRTSYSAVNDSNTFLYYAVASNPFKTSNAR